MKKTAKPSIKNATKPAAKEVTTKKPEPKADVVAQDRELFLKMAKDAGVRIEEKTGWFKLTGSDKKLRCYIARKGPQVHFTFPVKGCESISEAEAKKRHIGSVRAILHLDRQKTDVLKPMFSEALKSLR